MTQVSTHSTLSQLIDFVADVTDGEELETHGESMERVEELLEDFEGDVVQLVLFADRIRKIGKKIWDEKRESAHNQLRLEGIDSKATVYGIEVTPTTRTTYELGKYEEDPQLQNYKEREEEAKQEKKKWREARKDYIDKLVQEGKYEEKSVTRSIRINRG